MMTNEHVLVSSLNIILDTMMNRLTISQQDVNFLLCSISKHLNEFDDRQILSEKNILSQLNDLIVILH